LLSVGGCTAAPEDTPRTEAEPPEVAVVEPPTQAELEALYVAAKSRAAGEADAFAEVERDLRLVVEQANDAHLRANAALLLGSLHEQRGDLRSAISFYDQARVLIDEPETVAVLALSLFAAGRTAEAIDRQRELIERLPDDLEARLVLGEMLVKSGRKDEAIEAYGSYELRRKGLVDGLTLTNQDGTFVVGPEERAACARALAPASDNGTALVLLTAMRIEPDPMVRAELAATMGQQRLVGYRSFLDEHLKEEKEAAVREAIEWAIGEIERDPVDARPEPVPPAPVPPQ
jgi:tetratricopeptide (TPR) repeat protein